MAESPFFKVKLAGLDEIRATLRQLPQETQNKVLTYAVRRAAAPMVKVAKSLAPVDTGALRSSIGVIVRRGKRGGDPYAIVGPERGRYFRKGKRLKKGADRRGADEPANYAHLVEFGHMSAAATGVNVATAKGSAIRRSKRSKKTEFTARSFVLPRPFMRPAVLRTQNEVAAALADGIAVGIDQAIERIVKNPAARG